MKATQLGKRLKELTGMSSYQTALEEVERLKEDVKPQKPLGVVITVDPGSSGTYWSDLLGDKWSLEQMRMIRGACLHFAGMLEPQIQQMERARIEAEVRAELEQNSDVK